MSEVRREDPGDDTPGTPADRHSIPIERRRLPGGVLVIAAVLLAIPVLALLIVPIYSSEDPHLWGFPFFYWYQLLWVFLASASTYAAYRVIANARGGEQS